ncbi:hypothetical protein V2J09_006493 [Rumex salicifolius]
MMDDDDGGRKESSKVDDDNSRVQEPLVRSLAEHDSKSILKPLQEIPLWVKNPYFDRVDWLNRFVQYTWPYRIRQSASKLRL